jgi:hypothetical protein
VLSESGTFIDNAVFPSPPPSKKRRRKSGSIGLAQEDRLTNLGLSEQQVVELPVYKEDWIDNLLSWLWPRKDRGKKIAGIPRTSVKSASQDDIDPYSQFK